jgi:hypothetical protein
MLNYCWCLQSILSVVTHKINVSVHMSIWTFFLVFVCGTRTQSLPVLFIYTLYIRTYSRCLGQYLNPGPHGYDGVLPTQSRHSSSHVYEIKFNKILLFRVSANLLLTIHISPGNFLKPRMLLKLRAVNKCLKLSYTHLKKDINLIFYRKGCQGAQGSPAVTTI